MQYFPYVFLLIQVYSTAHSELFPDSDSNSVLFPFTLSTLSNLQHLTIGRWSMPAMKNTVSEKRWATTISSTTRQYLQSFVSLSFLLRLSDRSFSKFSAGIFRTSIPLLKSTGAPLSSLVIPRHVRTSIFASPSNGFSPEDITNTLAQCPGLIRLVNLGTFSIKPDIKPGLEWWSLLVKIGLEF